jgi:membrane dipeptidase
VSTASAIPVIDGHNDTLTRIRNAPPGQARSFLERSAFGHLDLPRAQEGGLAGGFFAIFTASPDYARERKPQPSDGVEPVPGSWSVELPPRLDRRRARSFTLSVMSDLFRTIEASAGSMALVRTATELERCISDGTLAVILHVEGAEAIDPDLSLLDVLYEAGLRSLGPVWSRPTAFGHGVPFDFPRDPDTGPGLTPAGRRLIERCNALGILVDLSHMNARGFWDVAEISDAPLVATHSNAHALCPTPRNLTDAQLDAVAESGGVVGLNFNVGFLRADGDSDAETSLDEIVRHARYISDRIGVPHLALGSDFDGATMPGDLSDVTRLPALLDALLADGFGEDAVRAIAYENWIRVLSETWNHRPNY